MDVAALVDIGLALVMSFFTGRLLMPAEPMEFLPLSSGPFSLPSWLLLRLPILLSGGKKEGFASCSRIGLNLPPEDVSAPRKEESIEESRETDIGRLFSRFLFVIKASAGREMDSAVFGV